jgi:DNA polymerase-3 subunit alpha
MGIEVLPPDVNASGIDFTPVGDRILFGLSAVRNLGDGAIRQVIASRDADGPFRSLADLCDRIPSQQLNRRALEAMIHSGALDGLEPSGNRAQLMADLDLLVDWAAARARDRASGQGNLLDLLGGAADGAQQGGRVDPGAAPRAAAVSDYPPAEKLRLEKELLGFYISDHPLRQVSDRIRMLAPVSLAQLEEQPDRAAVSAVVMVTELRTVTTRKGDRMAILQLEDLTGSCEAVVFPRAHARLADHLMADARLLLWATVDRRDDRVQLIVEDCRGIEDLQLVLVELDGDQADDITIQHRLRECLQRHRPPQEAAGLRVPVVALLRQRDQCRLVRLGPQFCVADAEAAVRTLESAAFRAWSRSPLRCA